MPGPHARWRILERCPTHRCPCCNPTTLSLTPRHDPSVALRERFVSPVCADAPARRTLQEAPLGTALSLAALVSRRPPPTTGTALQPEDMARYLDRFLGR
jgi:hypothetical protein